MLNDLEWRNNAFSTRRGQGSGSAPVLLQMVAYDGRLDGLFQGAVMV